jgi:PHP family Zn ribbon phosphoesterase
MHPKALVAAFLARGLDMVAITDHNASENIVHVMQAARDTTLVVIPGMEVTTKEEVHVLALFASLEAVARFQEIIYSRLPGANDERRFGCQPIVNEREEVEAFNTHLLFSATDMELDEVTAGIHRLEGIAIASHIDRSFFSVISQLGCVPESPRFDALEISAALGIAGGRHRFPELSHYSLITSSDAHCLNDVGSSCTRMHLESPCFDEIKLALGRLGGRFVAESLP